MADRFEREIDEIIRKTGDLPPPPRETRRAARRTPRARGRRIFSLNARSMMLVSLVLLLIGSLLWSASSGLGGLIVLTGIVLLLVSYAIFFGNRNLWNQDPMLSIPMPLQPMITVPMSKRHILILILSQIRICVNTSSMCHSRRNSYFPHFYYATTLPESRLNIPT